MASKLLVDELAPYSHATDVTITAGKNITGANTQFKITGGSSTNMLTTDGAGALSWAAQFSGLSHLSQWRLTADFTNSVTPLINNLVAVSTPLGYGKLPASAPMTMDGFGKFTFPVTGTWYVIFSVNGATANYDSYESYIRTTTNNATYVTATKIMGHNENWTDWNLAYNSLLFNVTDITQCKCDFNIVVSASAVTTKGHADQNETYMTFIKLGDSL